MPNSVDYRTLLPPHGGYRRLRSFQSAEGIYDATVIFCDRFVDNRSRTRDQMVQAARSGVQNIAEGSVASGTSKKTEIKLTNVERASLEELLLDYQDFLRQRGMRVWDKDSPVSIRVRSLYRITAPTGDDPYNVRSADAETTANTLICMISQACYLLDRQLKAQERQFQEQGGFTERLYRYRKSQLEIVAPDLSDRSGQSNTSSFVPGCPLCGKPMVSRVARNGANPGRSFWGCSAYPECKGSRNQD